MALTLTLSGRRWELQASLLPQLQVRPLTVRWSRPDQSGCLLSFLCFAFRWTADRH